MKLCAQIALIGALTLLAGAATWQLHPRMPAYGEDRLGEGAVLPAEVIDRGDVLWVDARSEAEYVEGHWPGAILLNEDAWESYLGNFIVAWEPGQLVVVYCGEEACHSSQAVAQRLAEEFPGSDYRHLQGGWGALQPHLP